MLEIPKSMLIEMIRSGGGAEAADSAEEELPNRIDFDSDQDASLLRRHDLGPDALREEFGSGSPSTG